MIGEISNTSDILDLRDVIERFKDLEMDEERDEEENEEFNSLSELLGELRGYGGDEQFRGDWYPVTLIHKDYFETYAKDLVEECCELPRDLPAYIENNISWDGVAEDLLEDYSEVDFEGETYYYR